MEKGNPNRGKLGRRVKNESDNERKITNCRYETTEKSYERDREKFRRKTSGN